jgi:glycosyltransferase involved in cell wall biosynthesis
MRILFLTSIFPQPYAATRGTYTAHLCKALGGGHEVRVVSPWSWIDRLRGAVAAGRRPPSGGGPSDLVVDYPTHYYPPRVLRGAAGWFMWTSIRRRVRRILSEFSPDCVVSYWAYPDGAVALRAARSAGVPVAVMVGGSDVLLLARQQGPGRRIREVLGSADAVVTVGQDLKEKLIALGVDRERVHIVPRGVDASRFFQGDRAEARRRLGLSTEGRILLWVGRMVPVKGLDVLLQACERLRGLGFDFRLCLVGEGPLRKSLEEESRARGLSASITFVGSISHDELADWYRAANLTVLPSRSEGVPNVLRESLACGTPFVASHVGGIPELADRPAEQLVAPEDPRALAEAISRAFSGPGLLSTRTRSLSWSESAGALATILGDLIAAPAIAPPDGRPR